LEAEEEVRREEAKSKRVLRALVRYLDDNFLAVFGYYIEETNAEG